MTSDVPSTMRSLVAPKRCLPSEYQVIDMPVPKITKPTDVLLRMKAASIQNGDTMLAERGGLLNLVKHEYPMKLGIQGSGIVAAVGPEVKSFKVGDPVFGFNLDKPMFREPPPGLISQYAIVPESLLMKKPDNLSFEESASIIGTTVTAYQSLRLALEMRGEESFKGKTVYVPGALSGTGSMGIQVARNVFGAERIISTVSTPKMPLVEEYLPCMVDQLIDYTKQRVTDVVPRGSVDFAYNTQFPTLDECIALSNPRTGTIVSIASAPHKETLREIIGADLFPAWLGWLLDVVQLYYRFKLRGTDIRYSFLSGSPQKREDMEKVGEFIAAGKVKAVIKVVDLEDIDAVRSMCDQVYGRKGGLGNPVIRIP
ncbi:chaperonin 10-like protein [Stachybotrys elegans]|uniref:Chaperonin 10-like protein n=1 Tax=Stachybotrys elegans TaxID=80388 RepID=A0A8K0WPN0_9HYPO|nr:chaperonin 10-like protein [Stachybotrys elegans]